MKSPPAFLRGHYRSAMCFALSESDRARDRNDPVGAIRAWQLFLLLPRLLLLHPERGRQHSEVSFEGSPLCFCDRPVGAVSSTRVGRVQNSVQFRLADERRRAGGDDIQRRAERAEALVQLGEMSSGSTLLKELCWLLGRTRPSVNFKIRMSDLQCHEKSSPTISW